MRLRCHTSLPSTAAMCNDHALLQLLLIQTDHFPAVAGSKKMKMYTRCPGAAAARYLRQPQRWWLLHNPDGHDHARTRPASPTKTYRVVGKQAHRRIVLVSWPSVMLVSRVYCNAGLPAGLGEGEKLKLKLWQVFRLDRNVCPPGPQTVLSERTSNTRCIRHGYDKVV